MEAKIHMGSISISHTPESLHGNLESPSPARFFQEYNLQFRAGKYFTGKSKSIDFFPTALTGSTPRQAGSGILGEMQIGILFIAGEISSGDKIDKWIRHPVEKGVTHIVLKVMRGMPAFRQEQFHAGQKQSRARHGIVGQEMGYFCDRRQNADIGQDV